MERLFVAVRPPEEILRSIAKLPRPTADGVTWVRPEQWHATLRFLGDAPLDEVMAVMAERLRRANEFVGHSVPGGGTHGSENDGASG